MSLPRFRIRSLMVTTAITGMLLAGLVRDRDPTIVCIAFVLVTAPFLWMGYRVTRTLFEPKRSMSWEERLAYAITLFLFTIVFMILAMLVGVYVVEWISD